MRTTARMPVVVIHHPARLRPERPVTCKSCPTTSKAARTLPGFTSAQTSFDRTKDMGRSRSGTYAVPSDVSVAVGLGRTARVRDRALLGVADELRILPQRTGLEVVAARRPCLAALRQLLVRQLDRDGPGLGVDRDDVSVLIRPIGPPTAASGPTWPMQKPRVAPENRPSVIRATLSPMPWP